MTSILNSAKKVLLKQDSKTLDHTVTKVLDQNVHIDVDAPLSYDQSQIRITILSSIVAAIQISVILAQMILIWIQTMKYKPQLIIPFIPQNIYGNYTE